MKYNLTYLNSTDNFIWGVMVEVNNATNHFLGYCLIAMIFIVASFIFIRRTQDIAKSLMSALHISAILSLILYYAGLTTGVIFLDNVFILGLLVLEAMSLGAMYYFRTTN